MRCPSCHSQIPDGSARCPTCGTVIASEPMSGVYAMRPSVAGHSRDYRHEASGKRGKRRFPVLAIILILLIILGIIAGGAYWYFKTQTSDGATGNLSEYVASDNVASTLTGDGYTAIGSTYVKAPAGDTTASYLAGIATDLASAAMGDSSAAARIVGKSSGAQVVAMLDSSGNVLSSDAISAGATPAAVCLLSLDGESDNAADALAALEASEGLDSVAGTAGTSGLVASGTTSSGSAWNAVVVDASSYSSSASGYAVYLTLSNDATPVSISSPTSLAKQLMGSVG